MNFGCVKLVWIALVMVAVLGNLVTAAKKQTYVVRKAVPAPAIHVKVSVSSNPHSGYLPLPYWNPNGRTVALKKWPYYVTLDSKLHVLMDMDKRAKASKVKKYRMKTKWPSGAPAVFQPEGSLVLHEPLLHHNDDIKPVTEDTGEDTYFDFRTMRIVSGQEEDFDFAYF